MPPTMIRCPAKSGSKHLLTIEECLTCAGEDPQCQYTQALLLAMYANEIREGIHVTSMLTCPRQGVLKNRINYSIDPMGQWHLLRGKLAHLILEKATKGMSLPQKFVDIVNKGPKVQTELTLTITMGGKKITGTMDEYTRAKGLISDYKSTVKIPSWNRPYKNHQDQINIYAVMAEVNELPVSAGQVVYFDMQDAKRVPCPLYPKEEREALLKKRLALYVESENNPDNSIAEREWACKFCPPEVITACMGIDLKKNLNGKLPGDQVERVVRAFKDDRNL